MAQDHQHDHGSVTDLSRIEALAEQQVHRMTEHEGPFSLHVVGLGKAGADVIAAILAHPPNAFLDDPATRFSALAIDIGDQDLARVSRSGGRLPADRAQVTTVALPVPAASALLGELRRYREFLKMEYPRYYWNPNYEPWLPSDLAIPAAGEHFPRAVAKALYGVDYYTDGQVWKALEAFTDSVNASQATPIVCVVFGMGGGTGSGIVVDLARHLTSIKLGRRPWVVGIGILPCDGDPAAARDGALFPMINELDCMIDSEKNKGVMAVWGDLYKNPFTGGFFTVPQNEIYQQNKNLAATHDYLDQLLAEFLTHDNGADLYETLKMLNWLSVPADRWHPAIRSEPTERWVNMLSLRRAADAASLAGMELARRPSAGYSEVRVFEEKAPRKSAAEQEDKNLRQQVAAAVDTAVPAGVLRRSAPGAPGLSLVVPRLTKLDLAAFGPARAAYDQLSWDDKLLRHSWLLDLGVMLCEPSIRFEGMGGECIWGCACWVVVPHAAIRGEAPEGA